MYKSAFANCLRNRVDRGWRKVAISLSFFVLKAFFYLYTYSSQLLLITILLYCTFFLIHVPVYVLHQVNINTVITHFYEYIYVLKTCLAGL